MLVILKVASCFCDSFLMASFRSNAREIEMFDFRKGGSDASEQLNFAVDGKLDQNNTMKESCSDSPDSSKTFGETQLELFHHRHGLLVLHLAATMMFLPSLSAWLQVCILFKCLSGFELLTGFLGLLSF